MPSVSMDELLTFHASGSWTVRQLALRRIPSSRPIIPEIETLIEAAWGNAIARPGVHLFDGPLCRLESWRTSPDELCLTLSDTSYKAFLGTNLSHPELAERFGRGALANPVGVSPALITSDGQLMMGRRNGSVAYYPHRVHPFAGALDPADETPFSAILRELSEELAILSDEVTDIRCTGIAEDRSIRQPELIFAAWTRLTRLEVEKRLDRAEHHDTWAIDATRQAALQAVESHLADPSAASFTPVAVAALALWARNHG